MNIGYIPPSAAELDRRLIAANIDRDKVGSRLTSAAREIAIEQGLAAFKGMTGNGAAAQIGIRAATATVLKPEQ